MAIFSLNGPKWYKALPENLKEKSVKMLEERLSLTQSELEEQFLAKRVKARRPRKDELLMYQKFINAIKIRKF
jgi:hypothetical protein